MSKYDTPEVLNDVVQAILDERVEDLRFCVADGLDPDKKDAGGIPLLVTAVSQGKPASARALLDLGADPNCCTIITNQTPLHYAATANMPEMIALLAESDADLEKPDAYGLPPLHLAADRGKVAAVEAFLKAGASPLSTDSDGRTALDKTSKKYERTMDDAYWLCSRRLAEAARGPDDDALEREKTTRDIAVLKAHNPRRFRIKF